MEFVIVCMGARLLDIAALCALELLSMKIVMQQSYHMCLVATLLLV